MGLRHPATKFLRIIETKLKLLPYSLTTHFARRSGATSLADAEISTTNLKRAGRWKSTKVTEEYLENSAAQKANRMRML
eukprot:8921154-Ditylum_brightwellii.AAC.1